MKKILIFGSIIIALLVAISAITQMENKDDYYTNSISLTDLQKNMEAKKTKRFTSTKQIVHIVKGYHLSLFQWQKI